MKWNGYKEVNVVRRYKEHVNVSITQKIPKLRHPHTKGPLSQVRKGKQGYKRKNRPKCVCEAQWASNGKKKKKM